ncbi:MAG: hypothetical protein JNM21_14320 [Taibaiella sp.]|nr:hypothetical protein [Taibaiella sp.]
MKNLLAYSLVMLFLITSIVPAPVAAKSGYLPGALLSPPKQDARLDKTALAQLCDSLVLDNNYKAIIKSCASYVRDNAYKEVITPYLVAAYYFTGDSIKSRNILLREIKAKSYLEIINELLTGDNIALIKYFDIEQNRESVIALALEKYRNTVNASRKEGGEQVIRFQINDQRIRKLKYAYKKESPEFLEQMDRNLMSAFSTQNDSIYRFYKKHGRYFGEAEIGQSVSYWQPIILCHITDIELRNSFFQPLLEKAVQEGNTFKETLVNFILRTESFANPDFWNTINDRLPAIRKQYDLPDNYLFNPF